MLVLTSPDETIPSLLDDSEVVNLKDSSFTKKNMELYKVLKKLGKKISKTRYNGIQLNKNYTAKKHIDKNNIGESIIIGFGDYKGGDLNIETDDGIIKHDIRTPLLFNGAENYHWVSPIKSGTRYSVVFFKSPR